MTPELRFPEFGDNWANKKVNNVFSIFNGYAFSSIDSVDDGTLWVKIADVGIQEMKTDSLSYLPNIFKDKHSKFTLKTGDYVVALTRPILGGKLKIARINEFFNNSLLNQRVGKLVSNENLDYVYYLLQNKRLIKSIENNIAGSDPPNLSPKEINNIKVGLPSPEEQEKIANFLITVDKRINLLQKKKAELEQYKKGVMQKLFSQTIRFKKDDGSDFPDWEEKKLGEVFTSIKGKGLSKDKVIEDGKNECILYGELYTTYSEVVYKVTSKTNESDGVKSNVNDLLVPCSTTTTGIDLANVTALNKENVLLGGDITVLRTKQNIDSVFYAYYLSNYKKNQLAKYGQGTTIVHLYYSHFKVMKIDIPSFNEQQKIANSLSSIDKSIEKLGNQIDDLVVFKQGLLQKMFV